ncbi:oligosaccharide flippase family protein, partial [Candidatus Peregrinibacteria bacterium]|nr:oligosaccharide flippase family protein [Candidatus Peregrinibacteria bacterium]
MSTRQIASSTLWQIGSQITMAALSILTVKFVAIGLSKELAGNYNSAYGFLQLFGILADFGLYAVALREISRSELNREGVLGA